MSLLQTLRYKCHTLHYELTNTYEFSLYFTHSSVRERKALATRDCSRHVLVVGLHVAWDGPGHCGEVVVDGVDDSSHVGPFAET